ncbi:MAG TPA: hypothetical protein DCZ10_07015 [Pelotomaculum sp.]|nr:hypothetical protein [Pelotomaculum sp.]
MKSRIERRAVRRGGFRFVSSWKPMEYYVSRGVNMSPNDMLQVLADIWATCVIDYPAADHAEILRHIEALQMIIFGLKK